MSYVVEINDPQELAGYRLLWNSLLPQTRGASFFHSLDWLEAYWRHFGQDQKLRVLVVHGEAGPLGILPLCVRTERFKVGALRVLTYPLHDWGTFYGPIGPNATATLLAGMRHVRQTKQDWDLIDLRWTNTDHIDHGRSGRAMAQVGLAPLKAAWSETAVVDLSGTWDDYFAARTSKWRNNYRRNEKRLAAKGDVVHVRYRPEGEAYGDGDPRWDLYEQCEAIARGSWQGSSADGTTLSHDSVRPFLREAHARAAKLGMLDLNLLLVAGKPAAFAYNYHCDGSVYGLRVGRDPQFSRDGVGNVLYVRAIRDSFERGDTRYELGAGSLDCKREIASHTETSYRYTYFSAHVLRAQLLRAKHILSSWASSGEKKYEIRSSKSETNSKREIQMFQAT